MRRRLIHLACGAVVIGSLALVAFAAMKATGLGSVSFDGSVTIHHVGDIPLIDDRGRRILIGPAPHGSIVVLGYTGCGDECPVTLSRVSQVLARLPQDKTPRAFFVTVDPQYDSPATLRRYLAAWGNRVTGVTGQASALRSFYAELGSRDPGSRYRDHDARLFILNQSGEVQQELSPEASSADIRNTIAAL